MSEMLKYINKMIDVGGYPAEAKHLFKYMHYHGTIRCIEEGIDSQGEETGGWIVTHRVDTTQGQSGSPIFLIDASMT